MYYDTDNNVSVFALLKIQISNTSALGQPVSFGSEALKPETLAVAEDEKWQLARHFKIHLHPESMQQEHKLRAQRK